MNFLNLTNPLGWMVTAGSFIKDKVLGLFSNNNNSSSVGAMLPLIIIAVMIAFLAFTILPNLDNIKEKLGFGDSKETLISKLATQRSNTETVLSSNKALNDSINFITNVHEIEEQEGDKLDTYTNEIAKAHEVNKIKTVKAIAAISTTVDKSSIEKQRMIDEIEITSLWSEFCELNVSSECNKVT